MTISSIHCIQQGLIKEHLNYKLKTVKSSMCTLRTNQYYISFIEASRKSMTQKTYDIIFLIYCLGMTEVSGADILIIFICLQTHFFLWGIITLVKDRLNELRELKE